MNTDAVLTIVALLSFLVLLVGWMGAPLPAAAPEPPAARESAPAAASPLAA